MRGNTAVALLAILVVAGGFAVLTKPAADGFAPVLARTALGSPEQGLGRIIATSLNQSCQEQPQDCANLLRALTGLRESDWFVARAAVLDSAEEGRDSLVCLGVYSTWKCWFS